MKEQISRQTCLEILKVLGYENSILKHECLDMLIHSGFVKETDLEIANRIAYDLYKKLNFSEEFNEVIKSFQKVILRLEEQLKEINEQ